MPFRCVSHCQLLKTGQDGPLVYPDVISLHALSLFPLIGKETKVVNSLEIRLELVNGGFNFDLFSDLKKDKQ